MSGVRSQESTGQVNDVVHGNLEHKLQNGKKFTLVMMPEDEVHQSPVQGDGAYLAWKQYKGAGCAIPGKDQTRGHADTKRCRKDWCSRLPAGWQCRQHRSVPVPLMRAAGTSGRAYLSSSPVATTGKNRYEPLEGTKPVEKAVL